VNGSIATEDPRAADVQELLRRHLALSAASTPAEHAHALDLTGLLDPDVTLFGLRADGELLAIGALKQIDADHAELKSMHTAARARRRGIGRAMLEHLIAAARKRGYKQLSLETATPGLVILHRRLGSTY